MAVEWIAVKSADGVMARVTSEAFDVLYSQLGYEKIDEEEIVAFENQLAAANVVEVEEPAAAATVKTKPTPVAVPAPGVQGS